jgi:hypothetical protein
MLLQLFQVVYPLVRPRVALSLMESIRENGLNTLLSMSPEDFKAVSKVCDYNL